MRKIIIQSDGFTLTKSKCGHYWLHANDLDVEPRAKRITQADAEYLRNEPAFEASCIMDFGVGVFQKEGR